jgi:hypothetical protein
MDAMNKLRACALFSVIGLGLAVQDAAAWWCPCCLRCRCRMIVTSSQYNAFSPFCVDGVSGAAPGQFPAAGTVPTAPAGTKPAASPTFTPPMPTSAGSTSTMAPYSPGWPQVYPAAMQPNYFPGYYPGYGVMSNPTRGY